MCLLMQPQRILMIKAFFIVRKRDSERERVNEEIMSPELVKLFRHNSFEPEPAFWRKSAYLNSHSPPSPSIFFSRSFNVRCYTYIANNRSKLVSTRFQGRCIGIHFEFAASMQKRVFYSEIAFDS